MKVELAAALLHQPQVLFLDEPTLGLDITMQRRIRAFIADYNRRYSASVLLTSHYMADVEALCKRVIVIDHGRILFDGDLGALATDIAAYKELAVTIEGAVDLAAFGEVRARDGDRVTLRVPKSQAPSVTARLLAEHTVLDLTVEDPPIDDVIELLFSKGITR
jgi:ABC-2 type transport system ATP-binding protein